MNELVIDLLHSLFERRPDGLYWKHTVNSRAVSGSKAGSLGSNGYFRVGVNGRQCPVHVLAWAMDHGRFPVGFVDHRNGVTTDNSPGNLREASVSQNTCNSRLQKRSKTGVKGVTVDTKRNKYVAELRLNGKRRWHGRFNTLEEAAQAVHTARNRLHGEFANHG